MGMTLHLRSTQKSQLEGSMTHAKKVISQSVEKCIAALRGREKHLISALDRDRRLSQEILNRQRERLISKKNALDKVSIACLPHCAEQHV